MFGGHSISKFPGQPDPYERFMSQLFNVTEDLPGVSYPDASYFTSQFNLNSINSSLYTSHLVLKEGSEAISYGLKNTLPEKRGPDFRPKIRSTRMIDQNSGQKK